MKNRIYSDLNKLREMEDEDIDYSDIPETDEEFWGEAQVIFPAKKKVLHIRLDEDEVEWFKAKGKGCQIRIKAVLKAFKEAHSHKAWKVPVAHAERPRVVVENIMAMIRDESPMEVAGQEAEDRLYSIGEVFPDFHPGDTLKGARLMHELTQAQLAAMVGVKPGHISEMERGKRPIGKEMARRLSEALNTSYKVFLSLTPEREAKIGSAPA